MSPFQLARIFTIFTGDGVMTSPVLIQRVLDREGRNLWSSPEKGRRVLPKDAVAAVEGMMGEAVARGTGKNAALEGSKVFGKTGTSNGSKDSWFAGYVDNTVAVLWAGRDDNKSVETGGGGSLAAPLWRLLMSE